MICETNFLHKNCYKALSLHNLDYTTTSNDGFNHLIKWHKY